MRAIKILVTGPYNAGKTTLIRTLCGEAITTDRPVSSDTPIKPSTTVALDFGLVNIGGALVRLFGTPGQGRFSFMWRILSIGINGYVFMVDATDPLSLEEASHMYMFFRSMHPESPHVVSANKYDREKKLSLSAIREALKVPDNVPVIPTVAYDRESAVKLLEQLVSIIEKDLVVKLG